MGSPNANNALRLSIVLPVYNGEKFLPASLGSVAEAVASLNASERAQVEVVLCDNYSTDRTAELAEKHAPSCEYRIVRPASFEENRTRNWHYGLSQARAPWMMMLHADDMLVPAGLSRLLRECGRQLSSSAVMITGRHRDFADGQPTSRLRPAWPLGSLASGRDLRREVLAYHCIFPPFSVMRRATYEAVGGLDPRYELLQDWHLWIRLLGQGDLAFSTGEFGRWRTHGIAGKYATIMAREVLILSDEIPTLIPDFPASRLAKLRAMHQARARDLLPDDVPPEQVLASAPSVTALPTRAQAEVTMAEVYRTVRRGLLRVLLAGTMPSALTSKPKRVPSAS
jgi:glycosyltransferase involved in cell wall biosynthesis